MRFKTGSLSLSAHHWFPGFSFTVADALRNKRYNSLRKQGGVLAARSVNAIRIQYYQYSRCSLFLTSGSATFSYSSCPHVPHSSYGAVDRANHPHTEELDDSYPGDFALPSLRAAQHESGSCTPRCKANHEGDRIAIHFFFIFHESGKAPTSVRSIEVRPPVPHERTAWTHECREIRWWSASSLWLLHLLHWWVRHDH